MLEDAGFTDVIVRDYSSNIQPMTNLRIGTLFHQHGGWIRGLSGPQTLALCGHFSFQTRP